MATIKFRRGTSYPNGLTAGEPAFRTDTDQLYVHDGVTAIWVGALISTGDLTTGSTLTVPTQSAVKTYVDNQVAGGAVTSVSGITGAVGIAAGAAIAITTSGKTLTFSNTGVQSFNGSTGAVSFSNYVASAVAGSNITVSSATGNVTIGVTSTPSFTTITTTGTGSNSIGGNLTVTGNLTVNGTTTTVNSDVMTVDDPMIVIGLSGGLPLSVSDGGKDRGIAFTYYSAAGATGFFGWDASASRFIFTSSAVISGDVVGATPTYAPVQASSFYTLDAISQNTVQITPTSNSTNSSTYTLPDYVSGTFLIPSNAGTANYIIKSNGSASQPTWIDPNSSGFTAFAATQLATARNIALTGNVTATGVAFNGTAGITLTTVIPSSTVTNAMLVNSGFTLGSTSISLGSTTTTLAGLSSVTATTFNGALNGNANTATALQTARTFSLTGNVTASGITFDGTGNVALSTTIGAGVVTNAMLANSGFTLGSTNITLGSTTTTLAGLSSVTATTFTGSLSGTATTATNVTLTEATSANTSDLYPTFIASGATGGLLIDATSQAGLVALSYRPSTGVLTAYKVEAIVDGGSY